MGTFWQQMKSIILGFEAGEYKWSVNDRENMSADDKIGKILTPDDLFFPEMRNDDEEAILRDILTPITPPCHKEDTG